MLFSFLPQIPLGLFKITTLVVLTTALTHQLYYAWHYAQPTPNRHDWDSNPHWLVPTRAHVHAMVGGATDRMAPRLDPAAWTNETTMVTTRSTDNHRVFGACLMVKDDNELLPEWLAYHYTILPLRFVVLGLDYNSSQDPESILRRWRDHANLTYWILPAGNFSHRHSRMGAMNHRTAMPPHRVTRESQNLKVSHHHALVERQKGFVTACAELLHKHGVRWTSLIDTDEFVLPNKLSQQDETLTIDGKGPHSIRSTSLQVRTNDLQSIRTLSVADVLVDLYKRGVIGSCYTLPRLLVGALENRTCHEASSVQSWTFKHFPNQSFSTLRFLQHAPKGDFAHNKFGKVFLDLQQIPFATVSQQQPRSIHRPYKQHCGPGVVHFPDSFFYLNHYIGDWARYSSRSDQRRNRQEWEQRAHVDDGSPACETNLHEWIPRFVKVVGGTDVAKILLHH